MKRLTRGELDGRYDAVQWRDASLDAWNAIRDDLQAREDVKRAVVFLRWAVERDLFRNEDEEMDGELAEFLRGMPE